MKGCLVIGGILAAVVVLFLGVVWFVIGGTDSQEAQDHEVTVGVTHYEKEVGQSSASRTRYRLDYGYEYAGKSYRGTGYVPFRLWQPGQGLTACIDPDHPTRHALHPRRAVKCGTYLGTPGTATPVP